MDAQSSSSQTIMKLVRELHVAIMINKADISGYFPIKNEQQIINFLSKDNNDFEQKLKALVSLCLSAFQEGMTTKQYSVALKPLIFHKDYMNTHKWPPREK